MSSTPNAPEPSEGYAYEAASTPRWVIAILIVLFLGLGWLFYSGYQTRTELAAEVAKTNKLGDSLLALERQLNQSNERLAQLQGELQVTTEKLGLTQEELNRARRFAAEIQKEQKAAQAQLAAQIGQVKQESETKIGEVAGAVTGAKSDIEATRKDLEATKMKLERTIGDMGVMSGLIARNREELEELKRRGERNIFEFDLRKSNTPSRVGPIQIRLKKVDVKKLRYTLDVLADDKTIEKKDKTVNEPVQFYVKGARPPYEIVVFDVQKDRAIGYLTTPKEGQRN
jgi:chromosome segregation ATPase